jgi:signal transduction histidine kinase/sensor domain CHASE-containing protein
MSFLLRLKEIIPSLSLRREVLLLVITGLMIMGVIDWLVTKNFEQDQQYRQTLMAQQLQAQIQSSLEEHVTALLGLSVVYQNFVDINHYDFQQYGTSISENLPGFRRLFFVDPEGTIQHVYPLSEENNKFLGDSLTKEKELARVLNQAKTTRRPATSTLVFFLDTPRDLITVSPIYRKNNEFLGYAVGEVSLDQIWAPYSHADFLSRYQIQLLDPSHKGYFESVHLRDNGEQATRVSFPVADKEWSLLLEPKYSLMSELHYQRIGMWGVGFLILSLLIMLLTGSRRHKAELSEAQKQFEQIFHASPDGIVLLNDKLQFQLFNPPIREWTGLPEETLSEQTFFDLFTCQCPHLKKCQDLSFLLCTSDQFEDALPDTLETRLSCPDPQAPTRTLRLSASRIQDKNRKSDRNGFICVLGDISPSKELDRVKETYVATLTHDLKTPLLAQEMLLESLMNGQVGTVTAEQEKLLNGAHQSVQDLLEMVNATLLFYKLESSHLNLQRTAIDLAPMLREVLSSLQPLAAKRNLTLELETGSNLPQVWVDVIQLKRVLRNILYNAINYAYRQTPIRVVLKLAPLGSTEHDRNLLIEISNQGKGIQPEELPRIFDKYYSLSRKFKTIGTGLGLYIARRIVELHGGRIWAESEPDKDTRFFLSIPCPQKV